MTTRERVRRIRLIEKLSRNIEYAKKIGVSSKMVNKEK